MKDKKIMYKISQGMYVLTIQDGGCIVDSVSQVSGGDEPLIAVAVMKKNRTNELLHENERFAISIIGKNDDPSVIREFGFHSSRDYDKYQNIETESVMGERVIKGSLGYMILEKIDTIENDTHTLFIAKVVEGDRFKDEEAMTYGYYQENKDDLLKVKTSEGKTAWICTICGYIYYGEELPDDFTCPICGVGKDLFEKMK